MRTIILFLAALRVIQAPLCAQPPTITNQPASQAVWLGGNVTFAVGVSGIGPFTYHWQFDGDNLPGGSLITTVAGNGGFGGDGRAATQASLNSPANVAVDIFGNIFIADTSNNRVRKIDTNGVITTVAGNSLSPLSFPIPPLGDGGPATNASLYTPFGVVPDTAGNLFIADSGNSLIRRVDSNGIITSVAGNGDEGYSGDGGSATNASLNVPEGVAVDASGNLFIDDTENNVIRRVDTNGIITTVAGNGSYGYSGDGGLATNATLGEPSGIAADAFGNIFIVDSSFSVIRRVDTNGIISTFAGGGSDVPGDGELATNVALSLSDGVAVDTSGDVFIADSGDEAIRMVDTNGLISTLAGSYFSGFSGDGDSATNATFNFPEGVAVDTNGNIFIADSSNNRIREVGTNGNINTVAGGYLGDGGPSDESSLYNPSAVVLDAFGNLFIADTHDNLVRKVDTNGIITTLAGDEMNGYSGDGGPATNSSLDMPVALAADTFGNIYIADYNNGRIRKVATNGLITTVAGGSGDNTFFVFPFGDGGPATNANLIFPSGVAVDAAGNLFIAAVNLIRKVDTNGIITTLAGNATLGYSGDGGPATNSVLSGPSGVAVDASGNIFFADTGNHRVRKIDTHGIIMTEAGNGAFVGLPPLSLGDGGPATNASLGSPDGVVLDTSGNLFIADPAYNLIRRVDTNGIITSVAGDGEGHTYPPLNIRDNGSPTNANLLSPEGVTVDPAGNLFIADTGNERVREVTSNGVPTLTLSMADVTKAGNYDVVVMTPSGSVTSSVVNLIVVSCPLIYQAVHKSNGSFALNFVSQPNTTNVVFCATNLSPPVVWLPISTNIAGVNGGWQFTDTNAVNYQTLFYRSLMQ